MKQEVYEKAHAEMVQHYPKFVLPTVEAPSIDWIRVFNKRNTMTPKVSSDMEAKRVEMGSVGNIREWFEKVYDPIDLTKYNPRMIGNMDETMLQTKSRLLCIVKKGTRHAITKDTDTGEHIIVVVFVTTNGDTMPPLFILPLKNLPTNLDDLVKAGKIMISGQESGWIDQATFKSWLEQLCKWLKHRRIQFGLPEDAPFLLFLDSHSSRETSEIISSLQ